MYFTILAAIVDRVFKQVNHHADQIILTTHDGRQVGININREGFVSVPVGSCDDVGGEKKDDVIWEASAADLIHCSGVNVCKGHNDCKTATNACAGHATCKGTGFVAIPAKACADIGGKVDS